jgi:TatD DNase family protein
VLVDAHCHLGDGTFDEDRAAVIARARAAGVDHIVVIGTSLDDSTRASALARGSPGLSATAGLHPHDAATWSPEVEAGLDRLLARPEVRAVGETGLDFHYDHAPRAAQRRAFAGQLALATRHGKPVVVHAREADGDLSELLQTWGPRVPAVILHSFSAGALAFETGLAISAYFSFSGLITFKNWTGLDYVRACPAERLLVETDAPYLAPVPHRGRRNEPAFVRDVAAASARARGVAVEEIARQTTENALRAFGVASLADASRPTVVPASS